MTDITSARMVAEAGREQFCRGDVTPAFTEFVYKLETLIEEHDKAEEALAKACTQALNEGREWGSD